jgi:hypothetical protein
MNATLERLPERAKTLVLQVGDSLRDRVPDRAMHWVETGAAVGAMKTGTRAASKFARRNPTLLVAAAAGAGLIWYATRRRAKQQARDAALGGNSTRVEARRQSGGGRNGAADASVDRDQETVGVSGA